ATCQNKRNATRPLSGQALEWQRRALVKPSPQGWVGDRQEDLRPVGARCGGVALAALALAAILAAGCKRKAPSADAYGNFEATKVRVSAEVGGRLVDFAVEEGD